MPTKKEKSCTNITYALIIVAIIMVLGVVLYVQVLNSEYSDITSTDRWEMTLSHPEDQHMETFGCANVMPLLVIVAGIGLIITGYYLLKSEDDDDL